MLITIVGSESAAKAVAYAVALVKALEAPGTAVTVPDVSPTGPCSSIPWPSMIQRYETAAAKSAAEILSSVSVAAAKLGVACETLHVEDQRATEGIVAAAAETGCDLIVMASHGRAGFRDFCWEARHKWSLHLAPFPCRYVGDFGIELRAGTFC